MYLRDDPRESPTAIQVHCTNKPPLHLVGVTVFGWPALKPGRWRLFSVGYRGIVAESNQPYAAVSMTYIGMQQWDPVSVGAA